MTFTDNKCSQLEVYKGVARFFKAFPTMLLLWSKDYGKTPVTFKHIYRRRKEIESLLNRDPVVERFFRGA